MRCPKGFSSAEIQPQRWGILSWRQSSYQQSPRGFFFPFESTALLQLSDYNRLKASESNGITPASQFTGQPHFGKFISLNVVLVRWGSPHLQGVSSDILQSKDQMWEKKKRSMSSVREAKKFKKKTTQKTEPLTRPRRVGFFPLIVVFVEDMYNS